MTLSRFRALTAALCVLAAMLEHSGQARAATEAENLAECEAWRASWGPDRGGECVTVPYYAGSYIVQARMPGWGQGYMGTSWYPPAQEAQAANLAFCPGNMCGNPINTGTGNKFQTETDYAGTDLLQFVRYYNSAATAPTHLLGSHWSNSYTRRVETSPDWPSVAGLRRPDGSVTTFRWLSYAWSSKSDPAASLQRLVGPSGELLGWSYRKQDGREVEDYDALGRLTGITRTNGESVVVVYNNGLTENNANDFLPSRITTQDGRSLLIEYDASLRVRQLTDPAGAAYGYAYDAAGRLQSVTYPSGNSKTYLYNESAYTAGVDLPTALTGIVDEKGQRFATFNYQADGRAVSTEHAGGVEKVTVFYSTDGTTSLTLPSGAVQQRWFVTPNDMVRPWVTAVTAAGVTRSSGYSYDVNGYPDLVRDPAGTTTDYDYNARGLVTQVIESANLPSTMRTTQTVWDPIFSVPTERTLLNAAGAIESRSTLSYNARGQVLTAAPVDTTVTPNVVRITSFSYCEQAGVSAGTCPRVGLLIGVNGPRTDVTDVITYSYYQTDDVSCTSTPSSCPHRRGDPWKVVNSLGQVAEYLRYDGAGRLLSVKNANGVVTDLEYSARGWLTASKVRGVDNSTEVDDSITRLEYDPNGQVTKVTQPDATFLSFTYDPAHRLTDITDALGNIQHYGLDNAGNRISEASKDALGNVKHSLSRVYDSLDQLRTLADAFSTPTDLTYDVNGNVDLTTDSLGRVSDRDVDPLGRLVKVIANSGGTSSDKATSQFQYDARDNLVQVKDPKGLNTNYTYNAFDELTQLSSPDTGTSSFGYDSSGNRISQLDARGKTATFTYDALGRLTVQTVPTIAQNVYFDYDVPQAGCAVSEIFGAGRLARIRDESGSTRLCYDRRGNLVRKVQTVIGGSTLSTDATFNSADRLVAMTYPSGAIVVYSRDANGQILGVAAVPKPGAAQVTLVSSTARLPFGPLTALTFGTNIRVLTKAYDANYAIDKVSDSATSNPISEDFTVNAVGNLTGLTEATSATTTATRTLNYDGLDRLTSQKNSGTNIESFTYDPTGNRLTKTVGTTPISYTYPTTNHRLSSIGSTARTYDANGNTTAIDTSTKGKTFSYDDRNRLRDLKVAGKLAASYRYNGKGERVLRTVPTAANSRQYAYDEAGHLLGEYTTAGARVQEYVWLDDTLVAVLSDHDGSTYQYVDTDHLGTPRAVIHPTKNTVIWRWNVNNTVFGEHLPLADPDANGLTYTLNVRFAGQYYDAESGLSQNGFRDYEAATGRYTQPDPIGLLGGVSAYGYVSGNPLSYIDPYGLARFGSRPLGDGSDVLEPGDTAGGPGSHYQVHEQLWFDDYPNDNVGFFSGDGKGWGPAVCGENGEVRSDKNHKRNQFSFYGPVFDDKLMRQALHNIKPQWNNGTYCVVGHNCQHFADALRAEYVRLLPTQPRHRH